jgi:hypothetical protein
VWYFFLMCGGNWRGHACLPSHSRHAGIGEVTHLTSRQGM